MSDTWIFECQECHALLRAQSYSRANQKACPGCGRTPADESGLNRLYRRIGRLN